MNNVVLRGLLVCRNSDEAALVREHLPRHIELTLSEHGCLEFEVTQSAEPLVWEVRERFVHSAAFRAHQDRVASTDWGRATAAIERRYEVFGLEA